LLGNEIDVAIHALKDIPGDIPMHPDLVLCGFLSRSNPRDALIMRSGFDIPRTDTEGLTIGTSSPRRHAQLKHLYPGVTVNALRGNVDTRLTKLQNGEYDGIVVSLSGLEYLGMTEHVSKVYEPEEMLPAVGQGVLCLQIRRADFEKCDYLRTLNSPETETAIRVEREMLRVLNGNCHSAIAGHCTYDNSTLTMHGMVLSADGKLVVQSTSSQPASARPEDLGSAVGNELLLMGAGKLIPNIS
jgi:hydroxymethylbilane synthase